MGVWEANGETYAERMEQIAIAQYDALRRCQSYLGVLVFVAIAPIALALIAGLVVLFTRGV